ncbi:MULTISPECIES: cache domain-containing protein [unclassified Oceanispirochaeta]|uniref:cache domain-containing protein n=1 Tax=unclassified Oceanispirochaeta TaxID=2635722 RepID=UPI0011C082FC|nr:MULTISPECIES: cache domain-containing protein [unclassified Oceanispirochaeta]MBF9016570.1 cache domain-containing protein [Oceanispirochaeta sp. M2]NPD73033.1 PAS domain S-box protein [Oceanispirochaeta sp. M1]
MKRIKDERKGITRKGILISFVFIFLTVILTLSYSNLTREQRLDHLKQTVQIADQVINPIIVSYQEGDLSRNDAINAIRDMVRNMIYQDSYGDNYIFMSNYEGIMLVQPFQPEMEMSDMWGLQDSRGKYIIRALVDAAKSSQGSGYVSYYYMRPNSIRPEMKISYVIGISELDCYIGTGQYMTDIRRSLWLYISITFFLSMTLLSLMYFLIHYILGVYDKQNEMVLEENRELKKMESALRISEKKYRELFEQSPIGLALCRMNGELVSVNSSYTSILGYSNDEVLKLSYWDITPDKYFDQEKKVVQDLQDNGRYGPFEKEYIHKDGHLVPVRLNGLLVERDGQSYIWSSVEDISVYKKVEDEKHNLEDQLQQVYKMEAVGTLAGGIAHDFNNLLFPILGYTEQLMSDFEKDSSTYNNLEVIFNSASRAKDLVQQILTFSRQEKSTDNIFRMQPEVENALRLLRATIPTTIEIQQNLDPDCRTIKGDPTQLHQIVMNLATNSYHAMEATGGVLKVSLHELSPGGTDFEHQNILAESYALLTVEDHGVGIDEKIIDKIFDPFFTTKVKERGTGMGLSVVHGIINSMDGFVKVKSELGAGSKFKIYFPIREDLAIIKSHLPEEKEYRGGHESILLVDDVPEILEMEEIMLSRLGYKITVSLNGQEALDIFKNNPDSFDIIITDQTMPVLSGDKLISEVKLIRPEIPVILCSGNNQVISDSMMKDLAVSSYLDKPILIKDIADAIRKALDQ